LLGRAALVATLRLSDERQVLDSDPVFAALSDAAKGGLTHLPTAWVLGASRMNQKHGLGRPSRSLRVWLRKRCRISQGSRMRHQPSSPGSHANATEGRQALDDDAQKLLEEAVSAIATTARPADCDSLTANPVGFRVSRGGIDVTVSFNARELASCATAAGIVHNGREWVGRDGTRKMAVAAIVARVLSDLEAVAPKVGEPSWLRVRTADAEAPDPSWMRIEASQPTAR
jgi:hypothetical protein